MKRESDARAALSDTAKLRTLDVLHGEIARERRKRPRADDRQICRPSYGECQQRLIEAGLWPAYTP